MPAPAGASPHAVVLFDGVCNLCNGAVQFVIPRDAPGYFRFAALQSDAAAKLLGEGRPTAAGLHSVLLFEDGRLYEKSTAALRIARRLSWPWPLLYGLIAVPRALRDLVYDAIARRRYRWFGTRERCLVPAPGVRDRFLVDTPPSGPLR